MFVLDITRQKIEKEVFSYGSSSDNWRVFLYDIHTAKIIGNIFSISDILNHNILTIKQLELKREKINFPGLYFVNLTKDTYNTIKYDIKNKIYTYFYIILIQNSEYKQKLEKYEGVQIKEFIINHVPVEERVFTFSDVKEGIRSLFNQPIKKVYFSEKNRSTAESLFKEEKHGIEVVLLDRSIDMYTPLIHFYTFQCILKDYDLEMKDEDELWHNIRHKHIAEVNKILVNESKAIVSTVRNIDDANSKNLMQLVLQVPEQIKLKESISFYLKQLDEVFDFYEQKSKKVTEIEQNFCTGFNADGTKFNMRLDEIFNLFFDDFLMKEDKLRIFLLLNLRITFQENEINSLVKKGIFTKEEVNLAYKIKKFNFRCQIARNNFTYKISRFVPLLDKILVNILENRSHLSCLGEVKEVSLRKTGFSSDRKKRTIVVLYDGPITYAEVCVVYELSKIMNVDFFIGGKCLLTPKEFIEWLKKTEIK